MNRTAEVKRVTKETDIYTRLNLDGEGKFDEFKQHFSVVKSWTVG